MYIHLYNTSAYSYVRRPSQKGFRYSQVNYSYFCHFQQLNNSFIWILYALKHVMWLCLCRPNFLTGHNHEFPFRIARVQNLPTCFIFKDFTSVFADDVSRYRRTSKCRWHDQKQNSIVVKMTMKQVIKPKFKLYSRPGTRCF